MGRETLILNHHCFAVISKHSMEVETDRQLAVKPRRQLAVNTDNFPANKAAYPSPYVMPCISLNLVGTAENGVEVYYLDFILTRQSHIFYLANKRK